MGGKQRLATCESLMVGALTIEEARRRRAEILQRSRRGRILLRIERAERLARAVLECQIELNPRDMREGRSKLGGCKRSCCDLS
jgi:hypothetical protein